MDSRILGYVVAVAETGSFTGAADRCHVAQPSLSRQIAALERELGEILFVRGREGATLTEAGRVLLPYARAAQTAVEDARALFTERAGRLTGELRLGVVSGLVDTAVPAAIARLSAAHEQLSIQITGGSGAELMDAVFLRSLDAAVLVWEIAPLPPGTTAHTLLTEDIVALHSRDMFTAASHGAPLSGRDLHTSPVITYSSRSEVGRLLRRAYGNVIDEALCHTDDQSLHLALAREGAGIALTAGSSLARSYGRQLVTRKLEPRIRFRKRLIHRTDTLTSPALRALLAELSGAPRQGVSRNDVSLLTGVPHTNG